MKVNITNVLIGVIVFTAFGFLTAYLYGWHCNAVQGSKYDLPNLMDTAKWTMGQLIALFSSHSFLNTSIPWLQKGGQDQSGK